jgi:hypothetical protein
VLLVGALWEEVFATALAAIVRMTVPGEQPVTETVKFGAVPTGALTEQVLEPVPDKEKSLDVRPVTASLNATSYVRVELFVIVARGAKVVSDGPRDVMVTYPDEELAPAVFT